MARLAVDDHLVTPPARQRFRHGPIGIERVAALVESDEFDIGAEPHGTAVGLECAGQEFQDRGFTCAVGPYDAEAVAAHQTQRQVFDDRNAAVAFCCLGKLGDEAAREPALRCVQPDAARREPALAHILSHGAQLAHAAHVAFAPSRYAAVHPIIFADDFAIELVALLLLFFEDLVAPVFECAKAAVEPARPAAVDPDGRARQRFEESAVVADQHKRRARRPEIGFEPLDRRQIEVVGWLVEQQHVGLGGEYAGERNAARFPAREVVRIFFPRQAKLIDQSLRLIGVVQWTKSRLDVGARGGVAGEVRFLRQIADARIGMREAFPVVGFDQPCRDAQQRRLARTIASDETDAIARFHGNVGAFEKRRAAKRQVDVFECQ